MSDPSHNVALAAEPTISNPLTPAARRRPTALPEEIDDGVMLADGNTWVLARIGLAPRLNEIRDRFYADSVVLREVGMTDVIRVAWVALLAHYDLTDSELISLLAGLTETQEKALVLATSVALFGPGQPNRTYTDWALASLYANGLDPVQIPPRFIPDVLDILVRTGRSVAQKEWIGAAMAADMRADLLSMMTPSPTP